MNSTNQIDDDTPLTGAGQSNSTHPIIAGPSYGSVAGNVTVSSNGNLGFGNSSSSTIWAGITAALTPQLTLMSVKDDVTYVIVLNDGSCLELEEQQRLTGRELIGLCKFFNIAGAAQHSKIDVKWSELIDALGIDRHFVPGLSKHTNYDTDCSTLFIFLIDAK